MDKYLEYESKLRGHIGGSVFGLILIAILVVAIIVLNKKVSTVKDKLDSIFIIVLIIVFALLGYSVFGTSIQNLNQDIKSQAYVTYYGEFSVSEDRNSYVTIEVEGKSVVLDGRCELPGGEYVGTVVYGQSSKRLLDVEIDTYKLDGNGH
jgi:hypothetical protein